MGFLFNVNLMLCALVDVAIGANSNIMAEMFAGTIQPGYYWYDYRAGFWGVLGQPCHGIIFPFIQEFDFPMPRKCGAGNTGVYVNVRELHQKDLNLLANRGLLIISNKSYIIDISSKVMDENSGKELDSLGILAPTDSYNLVPGVMEGVPASRNYDGGFSSKLMAKDLNIAAASAEEAGLVHPLTSQAQEIFNFARTDMKTKTSLVFSGTNTMAGANSSFLVIPRCSHRRES